MSSIILNDHNWSLKGNITFKEITTILEQVNHYDWERSITIDFSGVKEIDTTLISFILEQKRQAKKFGQVIYFKNCPPSLKSLSKLYGIEKYI